MITFSFYFFPSDDSSIAKWPRSRVLFFGDILLTFHLIKNRKKNHLYPLESPVKMAFHFLYNNYRNESVICENITKRRLKWDLKELRIRSTHYASRYTLPARDYRVFSTCFPPYFLGFKIPVLFWKIIIFIHSNWLMRSRNGSFLLNVRNVSST